MGHDDHESRSLGQTHVVAHIQLWGSRLHELLAPLELGRAGELYAQRHPFYVCVAMVVLEEALAKQALAKAADELFFSCAEAHEMESYGLAVYFSVQQLAVFFSCDV